MTLTRSQIHERVTDLFGETKAAREMLKLCAAECEDKDRLASLARQALDKARASVDALEAEGRELAAGYTQRVEEGIAVPGAPVAIEGHLEPVRAVFLGDPWVNCNGCGVPDGYIHIDGCQFGELMPGDPPGTVRRFYAGTDGPYEAKCANGDARITEAFEEATNPHD